MSTTRIKEKLSTLVSSQLPEFVQNDYTTFVTFLEAYYEFLEQDQAPQEVIQNIRSYADIDRSIDSFIQYFINQYCAKIPNSVLYDKKALVKNLRALYDSKGSEKSYRLLFQILYNKNIDIQYPYNQVLKASDGKWVQRTSFFMLTLSGSGTDVLNKNLFIKSPSTLYPITLSSRSAAIISTGTLNNTHEYFYDGSKNIPINVGDIIEYNNFKGVVIGVPVSAEIINPGSGFKVGDILPLTSGLGNSARLKVTKVSATGGILNVRFINYGVGYETDFYNFFTSSVSVPSSTTFSFTGGTAAIADYTGGFIEQGTITKQDYAVSYFAEDYQGILLNTFYTSTVPSTGSSSGAAAASGSPSDAAIYIRIGSSTRYPGYYATTDGFLSDTIYLEDQDYYQPFSYVIKVDEQLKDYKQAVLDLLHPVGTKLLGELSLSTEIDTITELTSFLRYLTSNFQEIFGIIDGGNAKDITKVPGVEALVASDFESMSMIKALEESAVLVDELTRHLSRPLANSTIISDSFSSNINISAGTDSIIVTDGGSITSEYADPTYFAEDYAGFVTFI